MGQDTSMVMPMPNYPTKTPGWEAAPNPRGPGYVIQEKPKPATPAPPPSTTPQKTPAVAPAETKAPTNTHAAVVETKTDTSAPQNADQQQPPLSHTDAFNACVAAAILTGMPDPSQFSSVANPMEWNALQEGWDNTDCGLPAYVNVMRLGACQIVARKDDETAVVFPDINNHVDQSLVEHLFDPTIPPPRWNMLWRVKTSQVVPRSMMVKSIVHSTDGLSLAVLTTGSDEEDKKLSVIQFAWEMARLEQNKKNSAYGQVLQRFFFDNRTELEICRPDPIVYMYDNTCSVALQTTLAAKQPHTAKQTRPPAAPKQTTSAAAPQQPKPQTSSTTLPSTTTTQPRPPLIPAVPKVENIDIKAPYRLDVDAGVGCFFVE
jgi:hypothetical protein